MAITPLKMAAAGVAMFTLLMVFAIQRIPVPEPAAASASQARAAEQRFNAAWQDTVAVIPPLKKADRLQIASTEPKPVTERMPPAPDAPVKRAACDPGAGRRACIATQAAARRTQCLLPPRHEEGRHSRRSFMALQARSIRTLRK